ncbi:hypothetical protein ElyMa_006611600 [Elysia marginata]|uniref:Uncharacterized protein n=1 Tax=Elysia marginata TaxID=1093978 RepID=A0AAV4IGK4_9GAST|nr:hypothetical protein ElyMa_006611600 [Elysia marginata]
MTRELPVAGSIQITTRVALALGKTTANNLLSSPGAYVKLCGLAVRHSLRDREVRDSILGRVKPVATISHTVATISLTVATISHTVVTISHTAAFLQWRHGGDNQPHSGDNQSHGDVSTEVPQWRQSAAQWRFYSGATVANTSH